MDTCDALIVGGGPAGSTCARRLVQAGLDVLVVDAASFPRHKACAGWITPRVFVLLESSASEYGAGRALEPITGFRTSVRGGPLIETRYDRTVSYAIRRTEFDDWLLGRSGARLRQGCRVDRLERTNGGWRINGCIQAPVLVGAGGHFCPVARALNGPRRRESVVAARVVEFGMSAAQDAACAVDMETPEIYLEPDLSGYGWIVRKGRVLNVGFGRVGARGLDARTAAFLSHVTALGRVPAGIPTRWPGHAYLLRETSCRSTAGEHALLVGDAAGVARGCSGEGIGPAIESGLAAADALIAAGGRYSGEALRAYPPMLDARLGPASSRFTIARALPPGLRALIARPLFGTRWFTRRFLVDRWLDDAA